MKRLVLLMFSFTMFLNVQSQDTSLSATADPSRLIYRSAAPRFNDLIHTKLEVHFDYSKSYMYGKAWITLKPHYYPTDSLTLDAKGMDLKEVSIFNSSKRSPLKYNYDGYTLRINLDKTYQSSENYTIYIDYTAKPNELNTRGSAALTEAKGLYFINPLGTDPNKPTQIWTQGETESNSAWFPTIDRPDQKTTEEIIMTVPSKYVSLSNGKLVSQIQNADGTRTDDWKQELPHAPYLFFMGIGDYAIIRDSYKDKEVSYYVEKDFAPVARKIFGYTPEMIAFYSRVLGVDYPWVKYAQMTARDYDLAGAMENTTATLHTSDLQQDARQLTDGNKYEDYVCHELFHQWFGDLVTTESWSNLTVNESMANFSETLWFEYKHGKDAGDATNFHDTEKYLADPRNFSKNLVRFYYTDLEVMFDEVTYSKGGRILNMLRNYVGDSAFFSALNLYLVTNKFKTAEAHNLRLAFEQVTGQDLNWYWNQWYFGSGHPLLDISYNYDELKKTAQVIVNQTQATGKIFRIPLAIDVYEANAKQRRKVWLEKASDTFYFPYSKHPELINVDGDKIVLCQKQDHKTLANFIYQYKHAGLYMDRREAIEYCSQHLDNPASLDLIRTALKDPYAGLRILAMNAIDMEKPGVKTAMEPVLFQMANKESDRVAQGTAIALLGTLKNPQYKSLFEKMAGDSSYTVAGKALTALSLLDANRAYQLAKEFVAQPAKGELQSAMSAIFIKEEDSSKFDFVIEGFDKMPMSEEKISALVNFSALILKMQNTEQVKKAVNAIVRLRDMIPGEDKKEISALINNTIFLQIANRKESAGLTEQANYIRSKMN